MYSLSFSHEFLSIEESQSRVDYWGGCFVEAGFGLFYDSSEWRGILVSCVEIRVMFWLMQVFNTSQVSSGSKQWKVLTTKTKPKTLFPCDIYFLENVFVINPFYFFIHQCGQHLQVLEFLCWTTTTLDYLGHFSECWLKSQQQRCLFF